MTLTQTRLGNRQMTLGNETDAAYALIDRLPMWSGPNEGTSRLTYLVGNVLYKVDYDGWGGNEAELANARRIAATCYLPPNIRIPEVTPYYINGHLVLAAEFIDGQTTGECIAAEIGIPCDCDEACIPEYINDALSEIGVNDKAWGNVIYRDGIYYAVDVEC